MTDDSVDPRPEDDYPRSLDEVQRELRRELGRLEEHLEPLLDLPALDSPAESVYRFVSTAERLEQSLTELGQTLDGLARPGPLDVSQLASRILQEMLLGLEKPLVLQVDWATDLPQPVVFGNPLGALLTRVFGLVGRFASPGDLLEISTRREDEDIAIRVEIQPSERLTGRETFEQLRLRADTLHEFVQDLGGRFEIAHIDATTCLEIRLPLGVPRR